MKVDRQGKAAILSETDEFNALIGFSQMRQALRNIALFMLGLYSGLRINELRLLNIGDVRDPNCKIKEAFQIRAQHTKTKISRTVYIHPFANNALAHYLTTRINALNKDPLWLSEHGGRVSPNCCQRTFQKAFRLAGIEGASTHSMRRTFINRLHDLNVPLGVIRDLAGHTDISTTSGYIEVKESHKLAAVMALSSEQLVKF